MFTPEVGLELVVEETSYRVAAHPAAPWMVYGQEGRAAIVYRLETETGEALALKVFKPRYRKPSLLRQAEQIAPFAALPGLRVCERTVLSPRKQPTLLSRYPDLLYAVLMPWIEGPTWMEVIVGKRPLEPETALAVAKQLAEVLSAMEEAGIAHGDLAAANVILPHLAGEGGVELVDVEGLYAPGLMRPEEVLSGSAGYAHAEVQQGYWGAEADRFAGAVLLAEMLGWCDERVRKAAWGESYFAPEEVQREGERYRLLLAVLKQRWGEEVAALFRRAWRSRTLGEAPTFGEWWLTLMQAQPAGLPSRESDEEMPPPPSSRPGEEEESGSFPEEIAGDRETGPHEEMEAPDIMREIARLEAMERPAEPRETGQAIRDQEETRLPLSEVTKRGVIWWKEASPLQIGIAIGAMLMLICVAFGAVGYALFSRGQSAEMAPGEPAVSTGLHQATPTPEATPTPLPTATPTPLPTATPTPTPIPAGAIRTSEKDEMIMHYVPAGEFTMGSDWDEIKNYPLAHEFRNEVPKHQVYLDAFWVDQTEVTNAQYGKCVEEGGCTPSGCRDNPAFNQPNQPVVCVTRAQAIAYCHWAGRELPTEAQWEKAARGTDGRLYPWGNIPQPSCSYAVMNDGGLSCGHGETTLPVGSKPEGASPYGALDMVGNVWEWVSDWYDPDYYSNSPYENPKGPDAPVDDHLGVRRGGSFNRDQPSQLRVAIRYWQDVNTSNKTSLGFRCVLPATP